MVFNHKSTTQPEQKCRRTVFKQSQKQIDGREQYCCKCLYTVFITYVAYFCRADTNHGELWMILLHKKMKIK